MALRGRQAASDEIYQAACRLFDEFWDGTPIRLIGIQTGKVSKEEDNRQMSLFDDTDYEKLKRLSAFQHFSVFSRSDSVFALEKTIEIIFVCKTKGITDLLKREGFVLKKLLGTDHLLMMDIFQ